MTTVLILPGYGGSGPSHWQSRWQEQDPDFVRVAMPSWENPLLDDWLAALGAEVRACASPPVVVAHSLGCLAVAHFAAGGGQLRGALLVAPPDPDGPLFPEDARDFGPPPRTRIAFPTVVLASTTDPYASLAFSRRCAEAWGSEWVEVGAVGHINGESGLGSWPEGRAMLERLLT